MMKWLCTILIVTCSISALAEYRLWEGSNGSTVEAELVSVKQGQVSLRKRDGKIVKVPSAKLSAEDQEYLLIAVPPKLDVFIKGNEPSWISDDQFEQKPFVGRFRYDYSAIIEKESSDAYPAPLTAWFILIGSDRYSDGGVKIVAAQRWTYEGLDKGKVKLKETCCAEFRARLSWPEKIESIQIESAVLFVLNANGGLISYDTDDESAWKKYMKDNGLDDPVGEKFFGEAEVIAEQEMVGDEVRASLAGKEFKLSYSSNANVARFCLMDDGTVSGEDSHKFCRNWDVSDSGELVLFTNYGQVFGCFRMISDADKPLQFTSSGGKTLAEVL